MSSARKAIMSRFESVLQLEWVYSLLLQTDPHFLVCSALPVRRGRTGRSRSAFCFIRVPSTPTNADADAEMPSDMWAEPGGNTISGETVHSGLHHFAKSLAVLRTLTISC